MEYKDYLNSKHWYDLKKDKRSRSKKRCAICSSDKNVHLHHIQYKRLFDVTTDDVRWLCKRCHFLAHELMKAGKVKFRGPTSNGRFTTTKTAVKKALGLTGKNLFSSTGSKETVTR